MAERMIPVPESLIENIRRTYSVLNLGPNVVDAFDALLSQTTPTAEPVQYDGHNGLAVFADAAQRLNEAGRVTIPDPPRIEDMAPGTTFTEEVRWTVTGTLSTGATVTHSTRGEMRFADRFDPSTIRDVTEPS